jgi:hypothetical protein
MAQVVLLVVSLVKVDQTDLMAQMALKKLVLMVVLMAVAVVLLGTALAIILQEQVLMVL